MKNIFILVLAGILLSSLALRAQENPSKGRDAAPAAGDTATSKGAIVTTPSGLKYEDMKVGTGDSPVRGKSVTVHYTGWLEEGKKFDSSRDGGEPLRFPIGVGRVIKGWDEGIMSMKVGGRRKLTIPPALGYGELGYPGAIPGNATLIFDVELLGVEK